MLGYRNKRLVLVKKTAACIVILSLLFTFQALSVVGAIDVYHELSISLSDNTCIIEVSDHSLLDNEERIAVALGHILKCIITSEYIEQLELCSLAGETFKVSYVEGYIWHEPDVPDNRLLEIAKTGITCFIQAPILSMFSPKYYAFNVGRNYDETYNIEYYAIYPLWVSSIDDWISCYQTHEFIMHMWN